VSRKNELLAGTAMTVGRGLGCGSAWASYVSWLALEGDIDEVRVKECLPDESPVSKGEGATRRLGR
jgi:hypothetical protein